MALNTSTSACCKLEEGAVSLKKTNSVKQTMSNQESKTNIFSNIVQPIIAELIGTTFFILIGLLGACNDDNKYHSLTTAFSFGFSLIIFIASLGHISGGHFNPAVTFGMFIAGAVDLKKGSLYILMQLIGGAMAAGIFRLLSHTTVYHRCYGGATFLVTVKTPKGSNGYILDRIDWWEGLSLELLLTFVFVTVILLVSVNQKSKSSFAPIYNGIALCACILASNMLTGGSLNPARSLGPAIFANVWSHHYIYWIGPLIGGTIAGGFYRYIWGRNDRLSTDDK
ncbi:unnamed protein product [Adineta ricciae]|uniref:Uncharacterized protein n=1 Tax=Adineta ricciae TaxID=249248 RepID=A0A814LX78_ADIRI|nr:unnamed protein product [Adineta ricciae]CAF1071395.1 unnamed protein product [Adineta ricciae]